MNRRSLYLALAFLGMLLPYVQFIPWVMENGLNFPRLIFEILHSNISAFAWMDVLISVIVIMTFAIWESRRLKMSFPIWPIVGCLLVGASFGLPLFLWQREGHLEKTQK